MPPSKRLQVFRVTGIPRKVTLAQLKEALAEDLTKYERKFTQIDAEIVPSCVDDSTNTGLVSFIPDTPKYLESLDRDKDTTQLRTEHGDLFIDKNFHGLTQLYRTIPGKRIAADIIAVTGLDVHAYGSWRGKGELGKMWLRDFCSEDFPNCRTMIYGYNSKLESVGVHEIRDYNAGFLEEVIKARKNQNVRPLIFIAHSFGGIIVSQSLLRALEEYHRGDLVMHAIFKSTKAIFFFGTPHRGLFTEDILSTVDKETHAERASLVESISKSSIELQQELGKFLEVVHNFMVFSFYERLKTKKLVKGPDGRFRRDGPYVVTVDKDSALLNLQGVGEKCIPVDGDHWTMVKFDTKHLPPYSTVASYIGKLLQNFAEEERSKAAADAVAMDKVRKELRWEVEEPLRQLQDIALELARYDPKNALQTLTSTLLSAIRSTALTQCLVEWLLGKGADATAHVDPTGQLCCPAIEAVLCGKVSTMRAFLDHGTDPNYKCPVGNSSLVNLAAATQQVEILRLLLEEKANPDSKGQMGDLPLHYAARSGHQQVVAVLLDGGADIEAVGQNGGNTALHEAAEHRRDSVISLLLDRHANVEARNEVEHTPLHRAASEAGVSTVRLFLNRRANVNAEDNNHDTPLHTAAASGRLTNICLLLDHGAKIDARDDGPGTALHIAVSIGDMAVLRELVRRHAHTEIRNAEGDTPLLRAVKQTGSGFIQQAARVLLDAGANVDVFDSKGWSPLHYAIEVVERHGEIKLLKLLLESTGKVDPQCSNTYHTPLHMAAGFGSVPAVTLLLDKNADIDAKDDTNYTPLHHAAHCGHLAVVELLISRGADIDAKDTGGDTPLDMATRCGHLAIIQLLVQIGAKRGSLDS